MMISTRWERQQGEIDAVIRELPLLFFDPVLPKLTMATHEHPYRRLFTRPECGLRQQEHYTQKCVLDA